MVPTFNIKKTSGYLLPVVLVLGIAISSISLFTLGTVSVNNGVLAQQSYGQQADDAARAGVAAAITCIEASQSVTWTSPLVPNSNCTGSTTGSTKSAYVNNDATNKVTSTYSVAVPTAPTNGVTTITSTGTVKVNSIAIQTRVARSLIKGIVIPDQVAATVTVGTHPMNVTVSPDGTKVYVSNQNSNSISVINTSTNTVSGTITLAAGTKPRGLGISSNGTRIYASDWSSNGRLTTINATNNTILNTKNLGIQRYPIAVTVAPDGSKALTVNNAGSDVSILNTSSFALTNVGTGYQNSDVVVTPDGLRAFVSVYGNTAQGDKVHVVNLSSNSIITKVSVGSSPGDMVLSPDASTLYVANQNDGTISAINTSTYSVSSIPIAGSTPVKMVISPDGKKLYVCNSSGGDGVDVIDTVTKTNIKSIPVSGGGNLWDIVINPDGTKVYVVGNQSGGRVSVINTVTNTFTKAVSVGTNPYYLTITPDGSKIYVANSGTNNVTVINTGGTSTGVTTSNF